MRFGYPAVAFMQLFISYGHDANRDFVLRMKDDLARRGHACWTVGFLSRHTMRPGGITPQELAIAQACGPAA